MTQVAVAAKPGGRKWLVLAVVCCAVFMMNLDITIVNIALPDIMKSFNVGLASIEWVINAYVLVFAVLLITMGKVGDLKGRKLLFMCGLAVFTIASLTCGLAPNEHVLIASRAVQAVGGAAMMPATLSILNVAFGDSGRGMALGIWGAVAGAAAALGPIIGGALVQAHSWRLIFLVNVPIGIAAFIAAAFIIAESTDPSARRRLDIPGVLAISVALFSITFGLVEGAKYGWTSALILALFAVGAAALVAFVFIERRAQAPIVRLEFFRNRTFSAGNVVGALLMFGLIGILFTLVMFLQNTLGYSAIKTGLVLLPMPAVTMIVAPISGRLSDRIGSRWLLFFGMLLTALGIYLMAGISSSTTWQQLMLPLPIAGLGMGLSLAPMTSAVMASVPVEQSGAAAGILSTMRQIGASLGISVLGAILQSRGDIDLALMVATYFCLAGAAAALLISSSASKDTVTPAVGA
jgi:EmrB/QacA subfamily drug resistance transporter